MPLHGKHAAPRSGTGVAPASAPDATSRRRGWRPNGARLAYALLKSNFEAEDPGWRFWRHFRKSNLADAATDRVFEGENDLVVAVSMTDLANGIPAVPDQTYDFTTSSLVHHCNYFQQSASLELIRRAFGA